MTPDEKHDAIESVLDNVIRSESFASDVCDEVSDIAGLDTPINEVGEFAARIVTEIEEFVAGKLPAKLIENDGPEGEPDYNAPAMGDSPSERNALRDSGHGRHVD